MHAYGRCSRAAPAPVASGGTSTPTASGTSAGRPRTSRSSRQVAAAVAARRRRSGPTEAARRRAADRRRSARGTRPARPTRRPTRRPKRWPKRWPTRHGRGSSRRRWWRCRCTRRVCAAAAMAPRCIASGRRAAQPLHPSSAPSTHCARCARCARRTRRVRPPRRAQSHALVEFEAFASERTPEEQLQEWVRLPACSPTCPACSLSCLLCSPTCPACSPSWLLCSPTCPAAAPAVISKVRVEQLLPRPPPPPPGWWTAVQEGDTLELFHEDGWWEVRGDA